MGFSWVHIKSSFLLFQNKLFQQNDARRERCTAGTMRACGCIIPLVASYTYFTREEPAPLGVREKYRTIKLLFILTFKPVKFHNIEMEFTQNNLFYGKYEEPRWGAFSTSNGPVFLSKFLFQHNEFWNSLHYLYDFNANLQKLNVRKSEDITPPSLNETWGSKSSSKFRPPRQVFAS